MTHSISTMMHYIGITVVCACLVVVLIKVVWNLGLPYAMMKDKRRGWSIFLLVELIPLILAMMMSALTAQTGVFSPSNVAVWGFSAIILSYIHLAVVALVHGFVTWLRRRS